MTRQLGMPPLDDYNMQLILLYNSC